MDVWVMWDETGMRGRAILCKDCAIQMGVFDTHAHPDVSIADALPGDRCDQCYMPLWGERNR